VGTPLDKPGGRRRDHRLLTGRADRTTVDRGWAPHLSHPRVLTLSLQPRLRRGAPPPRQPRIKHTQTRRLDLVPHLPSLPDDAVLSDVFRRFPDHAAPLSDYVQRLMRGPSPLSVAQRELMPNAPHPAVLQQFADDR
jgi:hypothetical protein